MGEDFEKGKHLLQKNCGSVLPKYFLPFEIYTGAVYPNLNSGKHPDQHNLLRLFRDGKKWVQPAELRSVREVSPLITSG